MKKQIEYEGLVKSTCNRLACMKTFMKVAEELPNIIQNLSIVK